MELSVIIITPEETVYDGPALSISTHNEEGALSIIPSHTNFISIVEKNIIVTKPDNQVQKIEIQQGVLFCRSDKIEIYIGINSMGDSKSQQRAPASEPVQPSPSPESS